MSQEFLALFFTQILFFTENVPYLPVPFCLNNKIFISVRMKPHYCDIYTHFPTKNDRTEWRAGWNWYLLDLGLNPGLDSYNYHLSLFIIPLTLRLFIC